MRLSLSRPRPHFALACSAALALALAGCSTDNPACIFGGDCSGGSGGTGANLNQAYLPSEGAWILDDAPVLETFRPNSGGAHSDTPVALRFSESMASATLLTAFELVELNVNGSPSPIPVVSSQSLLGQGRLLVLLPSQPLKAATSYQIRYRADAKPTDLSGQPIANAAGSLIGTFTVAGTNPAEPKLLMSWPFDGATNQSQTGEIDVVFDRKVLASSIDAQGWVVTVEGVAPVFDPAPAPVTSGLPFPVPDTRVWTWRSLDNEGQPSPLGVSATVKLELSPTNHSISEEDGGKLPNTVVDFETAPFGAPSQGLFVSLPQDAIGLPNLSAGNPESLKVSVQLQGAVSGDVLGIQLFGTSLGTEPKLVSLARSKTLSGGGLVSAELVLEDFDLVLGTSPLKARFADGSLSIALRLKRGTSTSPVHVIDVDFDTAGIQSPVLDTLAPTLSELAIPGGSTTLFRSDLRGLSIAGKASEKVERAIVSTSLGDNTAFPEVLGSTADGQFLASAVELGQIDPGDLPLDYTVVVYDHALNASAAATGLYTQVGANGPAPYVPGGTIEVELYDAQTLAPIAGALVTTHADDGGAYALVDNGQSDGSGRITLSAADALAAGTILSVDAHDIGSPAIDYDLFTWHGVSAAKVSLPLRRVSPGSAQVTGTITSQSAIAALTVPLINRRVADSRRDLHSVPTLAGSACLNLPLGGAPLECPFGPYPIRAQQLGAQSLLVGNFGLTQQSFSASSFLQAFELELPRPRKNAGTIDASTIEIAHLLSEPGLAVEELPIQFQNAGLFALLTQGIDFNNLVDDGALPGAPLISVESTVPGLPGSVVVGLGAAYDQGGFTWALRSAYTGKASPIGELVAKHALDPDLRLRAEFRDTAGNVAGQRRAQSKLAGAFPLPNYVVPTSVAQLLAPAQGGSSGGSSYTLSVENAIVDAQNEPALYRVTLSDLSGRRWVLLRADPPDSAGASVALRVPDLSLAGGQGLADGAISAQVESLGWPDFDAAHFFWTDLEREYSIFSRSQSVDFAQP